jgi:hypothetical protein
MLPSFAAVMATPVGVAVGRKGEPLAVRRPRRPEESVGAAWVALHVWSTREIAHIAAPQFEEPNICSVPIARRDEGETRSIG